METTTTTDICVVGGGPAGLTLALLLLRSGVSVAVVEKSRSLGREYRGEILQPGGMAVLDRLGVLRPARERGAYAHDRFQLVQGARVAFDSDYRRLPGPFNCLLSLPQEHLLTELLDACRAYDGFTYAPGVRVGELLSEGGQVRGVRGQGPDGAREFRSLVVAAADGRYSKVRALAGLATDRDEAFDSDVLWLKVPAEGPWESDGKAVRVHRGDGAPVLAYRSWPDSVQLGWTLPHGGYAEVARGGVASLRERIAASAPQHADAVRATLTSLSAVTLLDVFSATARRWSAGGLVLLGDSAHTHGPIGAQGINLAVQDAALLHPVLVRAVRTGDAGEDLLAGFERARRPAIEAVHRFQAMQGRMMLSTGRVAGAVRPVMARAITRTPMYRRMLRRIAYGSEPVEVREELLTVPAAPAR